MRHPLFFPFLCFFRREYLASQAYSRQNSSIGGKIAYERIYWDLASAFVQIGLLDANTLPVVGIERARKVLTRTCHRTR